MALRFLLVTLVAGMGLEMPSGPDFESWSRAGRDWATARVAELSGLRTEVERGLAVAADPVSSPAMPATTDFAFEAVNEGMASDFSADIALAGVEEPAPAPVVIAGMMALDKHDDPSAVPSCESADGIPSSESGRDEPADAVGLAPSKLVRLATAVRLTREAARAWAVLIQPAEAVATN